VAEVLIGQNGKAKLDLERAINLDLDCVDAYFNLGNIYRYEGDYDKAFYYYGISKNKLEKDFSIYKDKRDKMLKKINEELNFLNKNKNAKIKDKRLP
jgi:tetratricopeptide (TPR) repeat protein